jgi:hypothetical protein
MQEAMGWQVDSMRAFAQGRPPPPPPAVLLRASALSQAPGGGGLGGGLGGGSGVTALPFVEGSRALASEVVKAELDGLVAGGEREGRGVTD